ncbi:ATP-binding protein, partial [Acidianus hospitalis]
PKIAEANDLGEPFFLKYPDSPASKEFLSIADKVMKIVESNTK